jgi:hypothetical protein
MRRPTVWQGTLVGGLVVVALPSRAEAEPRVRLDYDAPAGCPGSAAVRSGLASRAPRVRFVGDEPRARTLRLRVTESGGVFHGSIEVGQADGATPRREIEGPACDALVAAMIIVAALSLDPAAAADDDASATRPASLPPPPLPPPPPSWPETVRAAPSDEPVASPKEPAPPPPPRAERPRRVHLGVGAAVELIGLDAPSPLVAPLAYVEIALASHGLLAPVVRAGVTREEGGAVRVSGPSASFTWLKGRLEPCPVRLRLVEGVVVRPCVGVDAGEVSASTTGVTRPTTPSRAWVDMTLEARLEWRPLRMLSLDLEGGVLLPFTRNTFAFEPGGVFAYEAPAAAGVGTLGATVLFW